MLMMEPAPPRKRSRWTVLLISFFVGFGLLTMLALGLLIAAAVTLKPMRMVGRSMEPVIHDGDRVVFSRRVGHIERRTIVVFHYPVDPSQSFVMRAIGLPGETIEVRDHQVYVNGQPLIEPYLVPHVVDSMEDTPPVELDSDEYFVMGDRRGHAADSQIWGPLRRDAIWGRYFGTYWAAK
jgi:signal peptidase I